MSNVTCPNCNTPLPAKEIAEGWCENCGKKIPTWIRGESPMPVSRDLRSPVFSNRITYSFAIQPASRLSRLAAVLLDSFLLYLAIVPGFFVSHDMDADADSFPLGGILLLLGASLVGLVQMILLSVSGQTVGKKIMKIHIVKIKDGGNPGFMGAVLLRSCVPGLIVGLPCVGSVFALIDILYIFAEDQRCLHDHIAGTIVTKTC